MPTVIAYRTTLENAYASNAPTAIFERSLALGATNSEAIDNKHAAIAARILAGLPT